MLRMVLNMLRMGYGVNPPTHTHTLTHSAPLSAAATLRTGQSRAVTTGSDVERDGLPHRTATAERVRASRGEPASSRHRVGYACRIALAPNQQSGVTRTAVARCLQEHRLSAALLHSLESSWSAFSVSEQSFRVSLRGVALDNRLATPPTPSCPSVLRLKPSTREPRSPTTTSRTDHPPNDQRPAPMDPRRGRAAARGLPPPVRRWDSHRALACLALRSSAEIPTRC